MKRTEIFKLINTDPDVIRVMIDGLDRTQDNNEKLRKLTVGVGQLAALLHDEGWRQAHLRKIFGFSIAWLGTLDVKNPSNLITAERERQEKLFTVDKKIHFTCASPSAAPKRKLHVLVEELGEVAECIDKIEFCAPAGARQADWAEHLKIELVQVAAVACAWLESMEVQS